MHEYILIFQNEGQIQINLGPGHRLPEEFIKQVSWSIWEMAVSYTKGHPAPFPDMLPERIIKLYTIEGETVLDPFGGSGTTMKVARDLERNSIIYEINPAYIGIIRNNIGWNNTTLNSGVKYDIKIRRPVTNRDR
jgi:site-specific DNA-methyltransferase (adenine-specific)